MRKIQKQRKTNETDITLELDLDGSAKSAIDTSVPFLDHMLELFSAHSGYDLFIKARGDGVDNHHVIEDVGIVLGKAFYEALGDKKGITRFADVLIPMDESLAEVAVDISGRSTLVYNVPFEREFLGTLETEMIEEFFKAFVDNAALTLHINLRYGSNNHHKAEAVFKGFAKALGKATKLKGDSLPSTKGVIE